MSELVEIGNAIANAKPETWLWFFIAMMNVATAIFTGMSWWMNR